MELKTPVKAIRSYCNTCGDGTFKDIRLCPHEACSIFPYRMGKRPKQVALDTGGKALANEQ
jgi:hypothetical protein